MPRLLIIPGWRLRNVEGRRFLDVDLDGYEDVLSPAGHTKDVQDLMRKNSFGRGAAQRDCSDLRSASPP
jgi:hypothetical protein